MSFLESINEQLIKNKNTVKCFQSLLPTNKTIFNGTDENHEVQKFEFIAKLNFEQGLGLLKLWRRYIFSLGDLD